MIARNIALPIKDLTQQVKELRQTLRKCLSTIEDTNVHQDQVLDTIVTQPFRQVGLLPPTFQGTNNYNGNSWFISVNLKHIANLHRKDVDQKCRLFILLLTTEAKIWVDRLPPGTKAVWNLLRVAFLERLLAQKEQQNFVREKALHSRVQRPTQSVDTYYLEVEKKALILKMAEPELFWQALQGRNLKYKYHLITQNF